MLPYSANQLRTILTNDPAGVLNFIVTNNEVAVAQNLQDLGFQRPTTLDMLLLQLNVLLKEGKYNTFVQALSVPMRTDVLTPEHIMVAAEVAKPYTGGKGYQTKFMRNQSRVDLDDIMRGLATGYLAMVGAGEEDQQNDAGEDAGDTGTGGNADAAGGKKQTTDTATIVLYVVGATILIIGLALTARWLIKRAKK